MTSNDRIGQLITTSVAVYEACLLPNGCLVAAPAQLPIYPPQAKSYFYCWPGRDLGFAIAGMETLGYLVREPLLDWIWKRAEGFQHTGLIFEDYHPNGPRRGPEWQPDQAGTLLWALCRAPRDDERERAVVSRLAEGLVTMWDGTNFRQRYRDLWERRFASPRHDSCFPYTLAACAKGLSLAAERLNVNQWHLTAREMRARLEGTWDAKLTYFPRRSGLIGTDERVDGSLLGLPIGVSMITSAIIYLALSGQDMSIAAEQVLNGLNGGRLPADLAEYFEGETGDSGYLPSPLAPLDAVRSGPDYLRFYCACVWGDEGPFMPVESPRSPVLRGIDASRERWADEIRPITAAHDGDTLVAEGLIAYGRSLFHTRLRLRNGSVTMEDDRPLATDVLPQRRHETPLRDLREGGAAGAQRSGTA